MNGRQVANELLKESIIRNRYGDDFPNFYNNFLEYLLKEKQPTTVKNYSQWTKLFLETLSERNGKELSSLNIDSLKDITEEDVQDYLSDMETELKNEKGEKKSRERVRMSWYSLRSLFSYLEQEGLIENNIMNNIKSPGKGRRKSKSYLDSKQIKEIIDNLQNDIQKAIDNNKEIEAAHLLRDLAIIETLLVTGMRGKALTQIKISDFDFEKQILTALDKGDKFFTYNLPDQYMDILKEYLKVRPILLNGRESDFLFLSERSKSCIMNYPTLYQIVKDQTRRVGNEVSPHRLRATYGRMIYNETGDLFLTQQMMGHSNWQTTMLYLDTVTEERKRMADNIISNSVFG